MAKMVTLPPGLVMDNTLRMYYQMDGDMMHNHFHGTDEGDQVAILTARTLVEDASVPLAIRIRAYMLLGSSNEDDHMEWAEESVRVAELIQTLVNKPGPVEQRLVRNSKEVLEKARQAQASKPDDAGDGQEESSPGIGEWSEKEEAKTKKRLALLAGGTSQKRKKDRDGPSR